MPPEQLEYIANNLRAVAVYLEQKRKDYLEVFPEGSVEDFVGWVVQEINLAVEKLTKKENGQ